jgi:hypothetical protein
MAHATMAEGIGGTLHSMPEVSESVFFAYRARSILMFTTTTNFDDLWYISRILTAYPHVVVIVLYHLRAGHLIALYPSHNFILVHPI